MTRHMISLIDGTMVSASQVNAYQSYSNVYELAYLLQLRDRSEDGGLQTVFYTSGISSQPGTKDLFSAATGYAIKSQILDQYTNICSNFDFSKLGNSDQDKIYMFGFSRGAMAVRALAAMIMEYGLLTPGDIRYAPRIIDDWQNKQPRPSYVSLHPVRTSFIGVFDSVMGGIEKMRTFNPIRFPNNYLSTFCDNGVHLLAIDEDRRFFKNRPWDGHGKDGSGTGLRQIWMPGVHSDVGGTANEFWGRAAFLAMTFYIDTLTDLKLDPVQIVRKQGNLRADLNGESYSIRQHRPIPPFAFSRRPTGKPFASESYHPIIDMIDEHMTYNDRDRFAWKSKRFDTRFNELTVNEELRTYFSSFL